jgi:hypothetical protein
MKCHSQLSNLSLVNWAELLPEKNSNYDNFGQQNSPAKIPKGLNLPLGLLLIQVNDLDLRYLSTHAASEDILRRCQSMLQKPYQWRDQVAKDCPPYLNPKAAVTLRFVEVNRRNAQIKSACNNIKAFFPGIPHWK